MTREHFESIYRSHFEALYRAAYLRLRQADDALDVVQDAMLHLWQKAECPDNAGAYLRRAVLNGVADKLRAQNQDERMRIILGEMQNEEYESEDESERTELKVRIEKILDNDISKEASSAFKAVYMRGLSYNEAADNLAVSRATINKHIVNVLRKLRECLTK